MRGILFTNTFRPSTSLPEEGDEAHFAMDPRRRWRSTERDPISRVALPWEQSHLEMIVSHRSCGKHLGFDPTNVIQTVSKGGGRRMDHNSPATSHCHDLWGAVCLWATPSWLALSTVRTNAIKSWSASSLAPRPTARITKEWPPTEFNTDPAQLTKGSDRPWGNVSHALSHIQLAN